MDKAVVLDASALLALMRNEPGAAAVASCVSRAMICAINLAEVQSALVIAGLDEQTAWWHIEQLECESVPFDSNLARIAGGLVAATRRLGLSLSERACLALALDRQAPAYTTNPKWKDLPLEVSVVLVA